MRSRARVSRHIVRVTATRVGCYSYVVSMALSGLDLSGRAWADVSEEWESTVAHKPAAAGKAAGAMDLALAAELEMMAETSRDGINLLFKKVGVLLQMWHKMSASVHSLRR
jgi:hypothetical protein